MATTSNTYTGNGSNKLFSITFPYLETTDVDVYLNGTLKTITTHYTFANATTIEFVTAPANGATVLLKRSTDDTTLKATFFAGSSIKATDLNDNFDQVLYVSQETANDIGSAIVTAGAAVTTANTALAQSTSAVNTANTASSTASSAVSTANSAVSTANGAVTTANGAVTTANGSVSTANSAVVTANAAVVTANSAVAAVGNALLYTIVANVGAIPTSPANNTAVEVTNSTGIESFTPLSGKPAGFIGSSGIAVRIIYQTSGSTWTWVQYYATDPESRYFKVTGGTVTGAAALTAGGTTTTAAVDNSSTTIASTAFVANQASSIAPLSNGTAAAGTSLRYSRQDHIHPSDTTRAPLESPTFTGTVTIPAGASISGYAPLANPSLTGTPLAPTATAGTNTTQIATTAFVLANNFPAGTAMLFAQTAAPTGWTKSTTHDNKALRVVSGTASYGGSTSFTSVFTSRTPTGYVADTTLSTAQMPSHTHYYEASNNTNQGAGLGGYLIANRGTYGANTGGAGGDGAHGHGFGGYAMDFAVAYVDVIIATKN
jgi:hypothetical protein